jgi:tRNA (adenine37-N6)-methyltransferase
MTNNHIELEKVSIKLIPIAKVKNSRSSPIDDNWAEIIADIELAEHIPTEAFTSISSFSHLEIVYYFDKVKREDIVFSGRPRGNPDYPLVGILGQRKKDRPNQIGLCTVQLLKHEGRIITVKYLDAIDGTPVLDIKPVFKEFQPRGEIKQPNWVEDLMKNYW